jgi:hypothetical protein
VESYVFIRKFAEAVLEEIARPGELYEFSFHHAVWVGPLYVSRSKTVVGVYLDEPHNRCVLLEPDVSNNFKIALGLAY